MRFQCSFANCGTKHGRSYVVNAEDIAEGLRRMADHWRVDHSGLEIEPVIVDSVLVVGPAVGGRTATKLIEAVGVGDSIEIYGGHWDTVTGVRHQGDEVVISTDRDTIKRVQRRYSVPRGTEVAVR